MFNLFHTIFVKITVVVTGIFMAVGLMSAPAMPKNEQEITVQETPTTTREIINVQNINIVEKKPAGSSGSAGGGSASKNVPTPPSNSVLCNGKYWMPTCPSGQKFYCPAAGDAQCIIENTQTPSAGAKDCAQKAIEQYREAQARTEADKKQCEMEYNNPALGTTESIICMMRGGGVPDPASYFSDCVGNSRLPNSEPTYSLPPSYSPPETPSFSELMRQREMCNLVKGIFLNGKCY